MIIEAASREEALCQRMTDVVLVHILMFFFFVFFLRFGHPDPEGSGRVSRQDCIQMPSYHLKPKSAL